MMSEPLLEVEDLHVEFNGRQGHVRAVRGLNYTINKGESMALVGESGSGKSVSALALLSLLPRKTAKITSGSVKFRGEELVGVSEKRMRELRGGSIAMIFQDPLSSLNPILTISDQIVEQIQAHEKAEGKQAKERAIELLDLVGIPAARERVKQYPHQLSGGMRQRAMIAMALSAGPDLLLADEPTTALDVTIQAQILELLARLQRDLGMSLLLITHDLGVVAGFTEHLTVMYAGKAVEQGRTSEVLSAPNHPYTLGLLRSIPRLDRPRTSALLPIAGTPPDMSKVSQGCTFEPRCEYALTKCSTENPLFEAISANRHAACWNPQHEAIERAGVAK
jgi:oligopeptide/dipeptide ABC transporter ATP-binding protein